MSTTKDPVPVELVDQEVQKSISNLVTALGGFDFDKGDYKLGDEALACLHDLKKWLQHYDAKYQALDVACAIANTTLVTSDLLEILSHWEAAGRKERSEYHDKVALACLELLVPLTWPLKRPTKENFGDESVSQYMAVLAAQVRYKDALVSYGQHNVLLAILRLAAKCNLRSSFSERSDYDDGVLTLVCALFRNLLVINDDNDEERKSLILEFSRQKVLSFIVTLGAGMGSHFQNQDFLLLESLFYLLRGIDPKLLYGVKVDKKDPAQGNLQSMLEIEDNMKQQVLKSTRHSRFGTLIAINEGHGRFSSMTGQRGVSSVDSTLNSMNETKKWSRRPNYRASEEKDATSYYSEVASAIHNSPEAVAVVVRLSDSFLDSAFSPVFLRIRGLIERPPKRMVRESYIHYLYLTAWFLQCERARDISRQKEMDFKLVGASLSTASLTTCMDLLQKGFQPGEFKNADLCHAAIVCLSETLMTVRDMAFSKDQELKDVSEGMRARFFYEEQWLQLLSSLPRSCKQKSLAYACDVALLTRNCLKMLDEYSKQHTYLFVRTKRLRKAKNSNRGDRYAEVDDSALLGVDDQIEEDRAEAERVTHERKFNLSKFLLKFINDNTIEFYERILENHKDVSEEVLLAVFSFLRRTFGKTPSKALFYRASMMRLLLLVSEALLPGTKVQKSCDEFLTYYVQKFVSLSRSLPSIHVNLAGTMTQEEAYYYDNSGQKRIRARRQVTHEFELVPEAADMPDEKRFAIVVAALIDLDKEDFLNFVYDKLQQLVITGIKQADLTDDRDVMDRVHSDALLRLLLKTLGLVTRTDVGMITVPADIDELRLISHLEWIAKYSKEPVDLGGREAMDFIVSTAAGEQAGQDGTDAMAENVTGHDSAEPHASDVLFVEDEDQFDNQRSGAKSPAQHQDADGRALDMETPSRVPFVTPDDSDEDGGLRPGSKRNLEQAFLEGASSDRIVNSVSAIRRRMQIGDDDSD